MTTPRRILHIDLDAFFVSVEQARDPSLRGRPVVVGGDPTGRGVVASASYEARRYGLRAAMPLAQARRLCPQAVFLKGDFPRYQEVSGYFMAILREYSPLVEPLGLDEAYVDLTGTERLWGPAAAVAATVRTRVRQELRITASAGIASGKTAAKVASDACKPDGLLEVAPGEDAAFLAPLRIEVLPGIGPALAEALHRLGVTTLGEVAALSAGTLHRAFGAWGEALHAHARGVDDRPVSPPSLPKSVSRETTFHEDTLDRALLLGTLHYLAERVGADLRRHGALARQVQVKLRWADFTTLTRQATLPQPAALDEVIFDAGLALFEALLEDAKQPVRLLGIGAADLAWGGAQMELLPRRGAGSLALQQALDDVRARYGFVAVQRGITLPLSSVAPVDHGRYILTNPALSR